MIKSTLINRLSINFIDEFCNKLVIIDDHKSIGNY